MWWGWGGEGNPDSKRASPPYEVLSLGGLEGIQTRILLPPFSCLPLSTDKYHTFGKRFNTFASHCYSLGSSPGCCLGLTLGHMWDLFRPSQPMPSAFPLPPSEGLEIDWNRLIRPTSLARTCSGWRKTMALPLYLYLQIQCFVLQINFPYVTFYYRPQTKFAKVMFLQVCVCPQGGGGWGHACFWGRVHAYFLGGCACFPGGVCASRGHVCFLGGMRGCRGCAWLQGGHAWLQGGHAWDTTRYGQWAGGTHNTGMHSCFKISPQCYTDEHFISQSATDIHTSVRLTE